MPGRLSIRHRNRDASDQGRKQCIDVVVAIPVALEKPAHQKIANKLDSQQEANGDAEGN
jgi:hypothetical protein